MHTPTIPHFDRAAPHWPAALALVLTAPLCAQYTVARLGDRPAERQGHAAFYDEPRGRVAIHGGAGYPAGNNPGDTWQLDAPRFQVAPPTVCATSNVFSNLSFTAPVTTNSPCGFAPSVPNDPSLVGNRLAFSAFVVQPSGCLAVLDPLHVIVQAP